MRRTSSEKDLRASDRELERNADWSILLADVEPTHRLIMARLLKRAGYQVRTAHDGQTALTMLDDEPFSLFITDWDLPEISGVQLCRRIRRQIRDRYIYTILLTSKDSIEYVVHGLQSGADDYLTKPVIERELMARLNTGKRIVSLERSLRTANSELQRMLICDPLTVAYNRRYLIEELPKALSSASDRGTPLSVVMCDVDHFKRINDTHGHPAGDQVLIEVANVLQSEAVAANGWLARYGGEEFTIVLPCMRLSAAREFAEVVRKRLSDEVIVVGNVEIQMTASFGVAGWEQVVPDGADADAIIALADEGVYESKSSGRNRVTTKFANYF